MDQNVDIIILSLMKWDAPLASTSFSLGKELSKNNRVFFINHPYSIKDVFRFYKSDKLLTAKKSIFWGKNHYFDLPGFVNFVAVTAPITLSINFLKPGKLYNFLMALNERLIFGCIKQIIQRYSIKKYIFINVFDPFYAQKFPVNFLLPERKIYYSVDDLTQIRYSDKHGTRLEREMIRNYDLTLATSTHLQRIQSEFSNHVYLLPNAADTQLFKQAINGKLERPKEIGHVNTKIIGYIGSIEFRTDFDLLKKIARSHTDKTLVLVGPILTENHVKIGLDKLENVIFIGQKNPSELPAFLQYMDCAIIPFLCTTLTKSIYPLKINEYLSAGKPVISTNFSEDLEDFRKLIFIGETHDSFTNLINIALQEDSNDLRMERMAYAENNNWSKRVSSFWEIINHSYSKE